MAIGTKELAITELDTFENERLVEELKKAKAEPRTCPSGQAGHCTDLHGDSRTRTRNPCHPSC